MQISDILSRVDHTLLDRCATWSDIKEVIDDGIKYSVASVCIPPCYVREASEYAKGRIAICTVIGFPNGYSVAPVKIAEAADAVASGADEIDMVINTAHLRDGRNNDVLDEIRAVKAAVGDKILKVIIETCLLTEEEKARACRLVSESGADFIKTSTGFSHGGATAEDVALLRREVSPHVKVKAAGGISTLADAERFIELGADRLGTSRIIKILKKEDGQGY
ncbi:MAG: deoxyribose-phosphate aldolase [Clostridia bacterium]|nr:deoxyribose-phosphate aldolase [Clostridia bacterium]